MNEAGFLTKEPAFFLRRGFAFSGEGAEDMSVMKNLLTGIVIREAGCIFELWYLLKKSVPFV